MPAWLKPAGHFARFCGDTLVWILCWALWVALAVVLCIQASIALSSELAVPHFVLRSLEAQFAAAHVHARFGRASFDPTGRILIENLQLSLTETSDPVVNARAVFVQLDPWQLVIGRIEPQRLQASGVTLYVPAMLSQSGRNEEILTGLDFALVPGERQFQLEHLNARLAGVAIEAHGAFELPRSPQSPGVEPLPLLATIASNYADISRQLVKVSAQLAVFQDPELHAELRPSPTRIAIAEITVSARSVKLPQLRELEITEVRTVAHLPVAGLGPSMAPLELDCESLRTTDGTARAVHAQLRGVFRPDAFSYEPRDVQFTADEISAHGFTLHSIIARLRPGPWPRLAGELVAECADHPIVVSGQADFARKSASGHVEGALAPAVLDSIGKLAGRDLRPVVGFSRPLELSLDARFTPGWKFEHVTGRIATRQLDAHTVPMDYVGGEVEFDGRHFIARHAVAIVGKNVARGTFEQDLVSRDYRFLLEGRLRPLEISGWFHTWWQNVFRYFDFHYAPPDASVDVVGRWRSPERSTVFVFVDATRPVIRDVPFDHARTLLFIRPNLIDGLEVVGTSGASDVHGTFTRLIDTEANQWRSMEFKARSTLPIASGAKLLGPEIADWLDPFTSENPPELEINGRLDGPATPGPRHQSLHIVGRSRGAFSLYQFPVNNLRFDALQQDDTLSLGDVEAGVAGGTLSGEATLKGRGADRRLSFDAALTDARLAQAVKAVSDYIALRTGNPDTSSGKFLTGDPETILNTTLKAEGRFTDRFSYHGSGTALLTGKELGRVQLLGLLSQLFSFTSLRFNTAHADFTVDGPRLIFPAVNITGANSAIRAHGTYAMDRRDLDFNAKVYPFRESTTLLQSLAGTVLMPLSSALEVKLTGPLDQPKWAFVIGPSNLFRTLTQPTQPAQPADNKPPPPSPAPYIQK